MKPASHPFHKTSVWGLYYERCLLPFLQQSVGEELTKTEEQFDTMDFVSKNCFVELKSRSDQYHYSQEFIKNKGWMLPTCKIQRAIKEVEQGKRVIFFYFWKAGKSLWRWDFHPEDLKDCKDEYPDWHRDQQKQTYVKENHWVRVF